MAEDWSRSTYRFSEHIRRMKTHLYLLLLAVGISVASQTNSVPELLTLLQEMGESITRDAKTWRIETPDNIDDVNCVSTIFKGTEQLRRIPAMKKFSVFFQKFERLKQRLTPNLKKEGICGTENQNARLFIQKLMTFIRKASHDRRA